MVPGPSGDQLQPPATAGKAPGGGQQAEPELGSHRLAVTARASMAIRASSSLAMAMILAQIWFWAQPWSGKFRRPVSFADRMLDPGPGFCGGLRGTGPGRWGCWWR